MKKTFRLWLTLILGVLAVGSAVMFFLLHDEYYGGWKKNTAEFSLASSSYSAALDNLSFSESIMLPTDFDGIYYHADLSGEITYYTLGKSGFEPYVGGVEIVEASVNRAYQTLSAKIYYITVSSKIFGCGVYAEDSDTDSSSVYPYAFFKLTDMPGGYGSSKLLLLDFDKTAFYKSDKLYSELFSFGMNSKKATLLVGENTRLVDLNGAPRGDWSLMTDGFLSSMGNADYYLSSRNYGLASLGKKNDVLRLGTSNFPEIAVSGILGMWIRNAKDGLHFLRDNDTSDGFDHILLSSSKETVVASFSGDYFDDYLIYNNYLLNKTDGKITDLLSGDVIETGATDILSADAFVLSPDAHRAVFIFSAEENEAETPVQKLIYCDFTAKTSDTFTEPMLYNESVGFIFIDNDKVLHSRAVSEDGGQTAMCMYSFEYAAAQKEKLSAESTAES